LLREMRKTPEKPKSFGVLGVSNVVANHVALKVKAGKELSSQPTRRTCAPWSLTRFSCQRKITMLSLIICLSISWQRIFPVPRADLFVMNAVSVEPRISSLARSVFLWMALLNVLLINYSRIFFVFPATTRLLSRQPSERALLSEASKGGYGPFAN
jgi:hypothetical protein